MRQRGPIPVFLLLVLCTSVGCASIFEVNASGDDGYVFSRDVLPVIQEAFVPLLTEDTGLDATSWEGLMAGSDQGAVVVAFDADRSLLVEVAEQAGPDGPTDEEIALVRRWIDGGARSDEGEIPFADADQLLYVCNQGAAVISVVDMETNLVVRNVDLRDLGFSENARPHHAAVDPDGSHWYVSLIGENTVLELDRDNQVVDQVPFEAPGMLAFDPSTDRLYVGRSMSAVNPPQRIGVADWQASAIDEIDVFFPRPHALQITPDGRYVYVASLAVNQMASIDAESMDVEIIDIPGPHHMLMQFAVAPDGSSMLVGGEMSGQLLFMDLGDPMHPTVSETLDLGADVWDPAFVPDGSRAFVPRKSADAVAVIDVASRTMTAEVSGPGLAQPQGIAVRPDGRYVYVSNNNLNGAYTPRYHRKGDPDGTVVVIDADTYEIVRVIEVEDYPTGIGTRPAS